MPSKDSSTSVFWTHAHYNLPMCWSAPDLTFRDSYHSQIWKLSTIYHWHSYSFLLRIWTIPFGKCVRPVTRGGALGARAPPPLDQKVRFLSPFVNCLFIHVFYLIRNGPFDNSRVGCRNPNVQASILKPIAILYKFKSNCKCYWKLGSNQWFWHENLQKFAPSAHNFWRHQFLDISMHPERQ